MLYLISFQYFVHPPYVTSTARYRVLSVFEYTVVEWPHTSEE